VNRDLLEFKFQGFITVTGLFEQIETAGRFIQQQQQTLALT
jgi:hypothetical protein